MLNFRVCVRNGSTEDWNNLGETLREGGRRAVSHVTEGPKISDFGAPLRTFFEGFEEFG